MPSPMPGAKLGSDLLVIINIAIENDDVAAGGGQHRLMTFGREVKNGKAPECEADSGCAVVESSGIIRAAMGENRSHPTKSFQRMLRPSFGLPESGDSAHRLTLSRVLVKHSNIIETFYEQESNLRRCLGACGE